MDKYNTILVEKWRFTISSFHAVVVSHNLPVEKSPAVFASRQTKQMTPLSSSYENISRIVNRTMHSDSVDSVSSTSSSHPLLNEVTICFRLRRYLASLQ